VRHAGGGGIRRRLSGDLGAGLNLPLSGMLGEGPEMLGEGSKTPGISPADPREISRPAH
jgi:hypothetical protein